MDSSDAIQVLILIALIGLSAYFSSSETALLTVSKIRIRNLIEDGNPQAVILGKVIEDQGKMLSAILIGNNIVNISASSLATTLAYSFGGYMVSIVTLILTPWQRSSRPGCWPEPDLPLWQPAFLLVFSH